MKITRRFTTEGQDVYSKFNWTKRTSRISNPDGSVVFEMKDAEIPANWSQLATDIMVSKYFRKAGVPQPDGTKGPETSARQVVHRLAGCWTHWGQTHGYFDTEADAKAFYDELAYMMLDQAAAPNSPQWFNTGLHFAYGITGPAQGHLYCDPKTGELLRASNAYEHPQPHACFIQSVKDDLVNEGGIMDLWVREARLFKYGSGTGSNFSRLRGEDEKLSGGGRSSGLMSFLKIGDKAAAAIKSGGTTRRAAKMVCLDLDHPDVEQFVNWKVREEIKVAAMVEGLKNLPAEQKELAQKLGLKLDFDFNGEAYYTVSGQNSNNSVRISNAFFEALANDDDWKLTSRINGKTLKTLKARALWDQVAFAAWRCADPGVQYDTTINQWHTCPASGRINASNPCVTGDTRVLTPGGIWRRIDQMIHLPARIVTNVDSKQIHVVEGAFPTGTREVFELTTESGYSVKLTADHKVWTTDRGWVEAKALRPSDHVRLMAEAACVEEVGEPVDARVFTLAGLMLSDANGALTSINLDRTLADESRRFEFAEYAHENWGMIEVLAGNADQATLTTTLTNRRLVSRVSAFGRIDRDTGHRRLSDDAFTAGLAAQKYILRGLFTADAVVDQSVTLRSTSAGLLQDVQTLLMGFGIKSIRTSKSLTIAPASLGAFVTHIGLADSVKSQSLEAIAAVDAAGSNTDRVLGLRPLGKQPVYDLTEPVTSSFVANGVTVHNCSEYMFLDDTACNLASLNVMRFFDAEKRSFDVESFRHAIRLWTVVLEISVLMASFPSEEIARLSYRYRTLGLGYANLGALLMQAGIAYDSEKGRAFCAAVTAVLTGESYATSAEMAKEHGAFAGLADNRDHMIRVMRNHRRAAYNAAPSEYEGLDIRPVGIDATQFTDRDTLVSSSLLKVARGCWDRCLALGEQHGYRNAQSTVIAPTGTIGLLMDCDTTGVEPDFALVKFKKLAGGGYFKIANQSVEPALRNLGYSDDQIGDMLKFVLGTLSLRNSPHINFESLLAKGFTHDELKKIEDSLPTMFELGFAFSAWTLGKAFFDRIGIAESEWQSPGFNLLRKLGFKKKQIDEASAVICGRGTVEGAPHLKSEHLSVFDCANKCGKTGQRFIAPAGHIRMMAAAQPFISGAISKTINLPNEATVEEIKECYQLSWELGLKANALYRDGSKLSQPLNIKSDADEEEDSEENIEAAKTEVADLVAAASTLATDASNIEPAPEHTKIIERIVERVVERPLRRRLPDTRHALTHKFDVGGHEGYITVGLYEDGTPGEVFITMAKEGSTIGGLMDTIATLVSVALQYGVPVESLVRKFEHVRFEPAGMTRNQDIPFAKSPVDYIFRWLAMEFVDGYRAAHSPRRQEPTDQPVAVAPRRSSNGHGTRMETVDVDPATVGVGSVERTDSSGLLNKIAAKPIRFDPLSQQGANMQSDAPACHSCGSVTVRSGTCYKCLNCGASLGCS
jgi:ribonucleoside-diphosphate reductase alpha chain